MVSIIIPAYNVEAYIDRCIESIVNQTFYDIEIIIVDDGSDDNTGFKCLSWTKKDNRIIYVRKQNEGQGEARNIGIDIAKYDYITFADSDDWCHPQYIEKLYNAIIEYSCDIAVCSKYGVNINYNTGEHVNHIIKHWITPNKRLLVQEDHDLIYKIKYSLWAKMFKKELFIKNNIKQPNHKFENNTIIPILVAKSEAICFINEPLYYYWLNRESSTVNKFSSFLEMKKCLLGVKESFISNGIFNNYYNSLLRFSDGNIKHTLKKAYLSNGYSVDDYNELEKDLYDFMIENYPGWYNTSKIKLCIWGSYNLRKIALNIVNSPTQIKKHFGFSTIVSAMSNNKYKNNYIFDIKHDNTFRQKMLQYDFDKTFVKLTKNDFYDEYILIDLLEESFGNVILNGNYYSKSLAFDDISKNISQKYSIVDIYDDCYWEIWKEKCLEFIDFLNNTVNTDRVFLVRTLLTEYMGEYEKEQKFENIEEIRLKNKFLNKCYDFFELNFKNIKIVNLYENKYNFSDKEFMFGCYPYHLNDMAYENISRTIIKKIIGK